MIFKTFLIFKFFLTEIKSIKSKVFYFLKFLKDISIIKLIRFIFSKKKSYPFRNKNINDYLDKNRFIWKKKESINNKKILVDLTLGHPAYSIWNCLIMKELSNYYKINKVDGIIKKYDYLSYFIGYSFGIKNFIFIDNGSFLSRIKFFIKALSLISEKNFKKKLIKLKYKNFAIGRVAYEYTVRNFAKKLFSKSQYHYFYIAIAKALFSQKNHRKIFSEKYIAFVLGEIQYIPNRLFYKFSTEKNIPIFAKIGGNIGEDISVRIYRKTKDANSIKGKFSKNIASFLINRSNREFKKKINNYFTKIKNSTTTQIEFENQYIENKHLKRPKIVKFKNKSDFNAHFNLTNKKNILIMPNIISDNSFSTEWSLFDTPLDWFIETLHKIKKIKNVNWIIKPHPSERAYNANLNIQDVYDSIIKKKERNILIFKEDYIVKDIYKFTDCVLTAYGSAGYQYCSLGIPVINTADAPYSNFSFTHEPKNKKEYFHLLKNLNKIKKPSKKNIYKAKLYWYSHEKVIRSKHNFVPLFDSYKNFDQKKFWELANNLNKIKNKRNNEFSKYFNFQVRNKNRHLLNTSTINYNKLESLKFNDT
tara:strand:+ start:1057 stop:2823 length:1767 start_codon:yes stop_codon:yes gene_type:complete